MLGAYRVLDLTTERGLLCGQILGDLGADVIKSSLQGVPPRATLDRSIKISHIQTAPYTGGRIIVTNAGLLSTLSKTQAERSSTASLRARISSLSRTCPVS